MIVEEGDLASISLIVNGHPVETTLDPSTTLQACLHDRMGFKEVRYGCGEGVCGACTVLVDGEPKASCLLLAVQAYHRRIVTAEGLANDLPVDLITCLRDQFIVRQAFQCGYCACGITVSAAHYLATTEQPDADGIRHSLSGHLCRCSGYRQMVEASQAAGRRQAVGAHAYRRADLEEKLSRDANYPSDHKIDHPLTGRILWSSFPSARIISIDVSRAKALPGVAAVLTAGDIPGRNITGATVFSAEQPLLADSVVRTMADAVALVVAQDAPTAAAALDLIDVRYEPIRAVTAVHEALKKTSAKLGPAGNVVAHFVEVRGDVDSAFSQTDLIVEEDFYTSSNDHGVIELEGGTGWMAGDTLVLAIPHQTPETGQRSVARILDIDPTKVRIVSPRMGGSFGKYAISTIEGYLGLMVHHTQRPVQLRLRRDEMLQRRTKRHSSYGHYRLGLTRDGTFVALEVDVLTDSGPYVWLTPAATSVMPGEATGVYEIPNVHARARGVRTNNLITAPMRGYGSQQIAYGIESIVEKAAHELGMDPALLRRRNLRAHRTDGWGCELPAPGIAETLARVTDKLGTAPKCPTGWVLGRGIATVRSKFGFPYGLDDRFVAKIILSEDGNVIVESDISDSGTSVAAEMVRLVERSLGLATSPVYRQNRAAIDDPTGHTFSKGYAPSWARRCMYSFIEWLQTSSARLVLRMTVRLEVDEIVRMMWLLSRPVNLFMSLIIRVKSALFPFGRDSFQPRFGGSRGVSLCTIAAMNALQLFKSRAVAVAARTLGVPKAELEVYEQGVRRRGNASNGLTWVEMAKHANGNIVGIGEAHNPRGQFLDPATGNQRGAYGFMDATHGCDLLVNRATGEVRLLNYVAAHDVGHAFNRDAVRGQVLGGIAMGIGQALLENVRVADGRVATAGFHDYLVPTALEMPAHCEVEIVESVGGPGAEGSRGVGESAAVAAPIAISNALYNAVGKQFRQLPVTPEEILDVLSKS